MAQGDSATASSLPPSLPPPHSSSGCSHFSQGLIGISRFSVLAGPFRNRVISAESSLRPSHLQGGCNVPLPLPPLQHLSRLPRPRWGWVGGQSGLETSLHLAGQYLGGAGA